MFRGLVKIALVTITAELIYCLGYSTGASTKNLDAKTIKIEVLDDKADKNEETNK